MFGSCSSFVRVGGAWRPEGAPSLEIATKLVGQDGGCGWELHACRFCGCRESVRDPSNWPYPPAGGIRDERAPTSRAARISHTSSYSSLCGRGAS